MNEIVTFGHPALISKSSDIDQIDDYIINLSKKMISLMYQAPGVGLAAPQIGINKNIFVFDAGEGPFVAINPKMEKKEGEIIFMEGCLSLPGYYWDIERAEYARISCLNEKGEEVEIGNDTWRTAGDLSKIAGGLGKDMRKCLESTK